MTDDDEEPPIVQRKRHCSTYDRLAQWIRSHDGAFVHPRIELAIATSPTTGDREQAHRYLHVVPNADDDNNDGSAIDPGTTQTDEREDSPVVIHKGETVMCLPDEVLIAAGRCEIALPPDVKASLESNQHVPRSDVQLALYLASQPSRIRPYLDSLPRQEESADAALPRCWKTSEVEEYLAGSLVVHRIHEHKKEVQDAYDALASAYEKGSVDALPSFRAFSQCLAVVTSRAFQGFDPDRHGPSCLVPLLDLCNHGRGSLSSSSSPASNLSYRWDADRRAVVAQARADLRRGDTLVITYGAQSNASLLLNYGFCIANNVEPDGSSNDRYELRVGPAASPRAAVVSLRAGPKEYSYGDLVTALDAVVEFLQLSTPKERPDHTVRSKADDLEAFLDECDNNDGEEDGDEHANANANATVKCNPNHDEDHYDVCDSEDSELENTSRTSLHLEMRALDELGTCLEEARSKYKEAVISNNQAKVGLDRQQYAAILVQSEQRTLYFHQCAVSRILSTATTASLERSPGNTSLPEPKPTSPPDWMTKSDIALIDDQVKALAQAYFRIRHSRPWI
jgi:hypothetical protein